MTRKSDRLKTIDHMGLTVPVKSTTPDAVAERKRQAILKYAEGYNTEEVSKIISIGRWTLHRWYREDEEFRRQRDAVQADRDADLSEEMEDLALGLARGETSKDNIPYFPAIKHMLGVTNPKRHGDKKQVEVTGSVVHTLVPTARRLDELTVAADIIDVPQVSDGDEDE